MEEYSRNLKRVATMLMFTSFGTTLIDFKEITNTTLDKMSFSLSFRFAGCCIGALLRALTLILGQLTKLWSVFFVQFLMGVASGAVEVICVAQIYQLWSDKGGPFMQATMFGWNLAGICSPLLFEPFLSPTKTNELPNSKIQVHLQMLVKLLTSR
ncbi:sodium-dependent glucose transporter 1A-like protein [Leptotrombidium deliense]|uniref:Sodium-dependent glucose transporter 1A-like protein n=1 Tax=Leptotrombidium deliense TaxID=299467 RepID=A0A443S3V2_9ACAR|nr:sodium-dependent glucose transporter 1A-like protein [Leptotrombidium deliense]